MPQSRRICLFFELRWREAEGECGFSSPKYYTVITGCSHQKHFFFPPQGNTSFYLCHSLERFVTNVCAVSHCLALQKAISRAGRQNYLRQNFTHFSGCLMKLELEQSRETAYCWFFFEITAQQTETE